ncbi:hypothetical protein S245_041619 [Arachis hypogaea]
MVPNKTGSKVEQNTSTQNKQQQHHTTMTTEVQQPPPFSAAAAIRLRDDKARASGGDTDNRAQATTCSDDTAAPPFFTTELKPSLSVSHCLLFSATVAQWFPLHRRHLPLLFLSFFPLLPMFFPHSSLSSRSILSLATSDGD